MFNPFQQLKDAILEQNVLPEELARALMATVYLKCCDDCFTQMHSDEFLENFRRMLTEMRLTAELSRKTAA